MLAFFHAQQRSIICYFRNPASGFKKMYALQENKNLFKEKNVFSLL